MKEVTLSASEDLLNKAHDNQNTLRLPHEQV